MTIEALMADIQHSTVVETIHLHERDDVRRVEQREDLAHLEELHANDAAARLLAVGVRKDRIDVEWRDHFGR